MSDPFATTDRIDDPLIRAQTSEALPATWSAGVGSFFDAQLDNIGNIAGRIFRADEALWRSRLLTRAEEFGGRSVLTDDEREISAEEATRDYGEDGLVKFSSPLTRGTAKERRRLAMIEAQRASAGERADLGVAGNIAGFGLAMAGSLLDPVQVAANFLPVVGQARYARWLERAGSSAAKRAGVRAGVGAVEGFAGAAAIEPLIAWGTSVEGRDYGMAQTLANLTIGTVLGGGLHSAIGGVADLADPDLRARRSAERILQTYDGIEEAGALRETAPSSGPVATRVRLADPRTRAKALDTALTQLDDDAPVDVAPVFAAAERDGARAADASEADLPELGHRLYADTRIYTPAGRALDARYAIVELDDLITSHNDGLLTNPAYPAALQPRDRGRSASEAQVQNIARKLEPALLIEGAGAGEGAPVISPRGIVESGNGRTISLRRARADNPEGYAKYRAELERRGYDLKGFRSPGLVRIRQTALDGTERLAFTREANAPTAAVLSGPEQARSDANALSDQVLELHAGGAMTSAANRDFVRRFIDTVATAESERGALYTAEGGLSPAGASRLQAALFAKAYGDADLVNLSIERAGGDLKTIAGALADAAPLWAQLRADIRAGLVPEELDLTADMLRAVWTIRRARDEAKPLTWYLDVGDLVEPFSPRVRGALSLFFKDADLTQPASRPKVAAALTAYAEAARRVDNAPRLFEDAGNDAGPLALVAAAFRRAERETDGGDGDVPPGQAGDAGEGAEGGGRAGPDGNGGEPAGDRQGNAPSQELTPRQPGEDGEAADIADRLSALREESAATLGRLTARAAQIGESADIFLKLADDEAAIVAEGQAKPATREQIQLDAKLRKRAAKAAAACLTSQKARA